MDEVDVLTPVISCYALLADSKRSGGWSQYCIVHGGMELVSWHSDLYLLVSRHGAWEKCPCSKTSKAPRRMQRVTVWLFYPHTKITFYLAAYTHSVGISGGEQRAGARYTGSFLGRFYSRTFPGGLSNI